MKTESKLLEKLASQIRDVRTDRGMTLAEVAEIAFGDKNRAIQVSHIELEKRGATVQTIAKIFDALNCDLLVVPREKTKEIQSLLNR